MFPSPRIVLIAFFAVLIFFPKNQARADDSGLTMRGWDDIPEEEVKASTPKIDPNAHLEFLYRKLHVSDGGSKDTTFTYHNRIKIFTEGGVQELDKIDIPYETGWRVYNIKGRIVYPDGTGVELQNSDIYKRQIFKDERFAGYAKSFSFPGLKPGCIVEYKWKQTRKYWVPTLTIPLRAEWPTWDFDLSINPYSALANTIMWHNCRVDVQKKSRQYLLRIFNEPATSSKPYLAPRKDFEPWIHLAYATELKMLEQENYWGYRGGALVEINKDFIKPKQKRIKELAAKLFEGLPFDEEKLKAAYDFCASEIINIGGYQTTYTEEEVEELKENKNPNDTLKNGYGTRYDINAIFASLAAAAGFSAHLAQVENHNNYTYQQGAVGAYNLSDWVVAVRYGKSWRYFDPGSSFLPFEVLNAENSDANSIQTDKKYYYMAKTPAAPNDFSTENRIANMKINEFGDLEGSVKIQYNGFSGISRKRLFEAMTEKEMEEYVLENEWQSRLSRATIDNFKVRNNDSRETALVVSYEVKIPGFADVVQGRILFKPSLFEQGRSPLFIDESRTEPIAFDYLAKVMDQVAYEIPEGFEMEGEANVTAAHEGLLTKRKSLVSVDAETGNLIFRREYQLKAKRVGANFYAIIKKEFEYNNEADARPVGLKKLEDLALVESL